AATQPEVSNWQLLGLQARAPPANPWPMVVQSLPPRSMPSHCSPASIWPLPQVLRGHCETSNWQMSVLQRRLPPVKPCPIVVQSSPPRFAPSHCSPPSITPSPQAASRWQEESQPSPSRLLPSSQSSPESTLPSPQAGRITRTSSEQEQRRRTG